MASRNFTNLADHMARARINFGADTFKALLVSSIPTEANLDAWAFRSSVTNEHASTGGYTAGGVAVTATVGTVDAVNDRVAVTFAASNPVLTSTKTPAPLARHRLRTSLTSARRLRVRTARTT